MLLLLVLVQALRLRRLGRRLDALTRGSAGSSLEAVIGSGLGRVDHVAHEMDNLSARSAVLEGTFRQSLQLVGLVRFNPFEDTGGNQSFALALLDGRGDGVVVTSLHARSGTRVYAKTLRGGRSDGALSTEEAQAVEQALGRAVAPHASSGLVAERARSAS